MPFPAKTTREEILAAAAQIIESEGWEALSMRNLAARLKVRASSLYHHFADRDALEAALAREAAGPLLEAAGDTEEFARTYLVFARAHVHLMKMIQPELRAAFEKRAGSAAAPLLAYLYGYAVLGLKEDRAFEAGLRALIPAKRHIL